MDWFTENSLVPMLTGVFMGAVFLGLAFFGREKRFLYVALGIGAVTSAIVVCELVIVTDREAVTECVQELANRVRTNDAPGVVAYISKSRPDTMKSAAREMARFRFEQCRITGTKSFDVRESGGKKSATIVFVVFARVQIDTMAGVTPVQPEVTLDFEKESDGKWRVVGYSYRNPRGGLTL